MIYGLKHETGFQDTFRMKIQFLRLQIKRIRNFRVDKMLFTLCQVPNELFRKSAHRGKEVQIVLENKKQKENQTK